MIPPPGGGVGFPPRPALAPPPRRPTILPTLARSRRNRPAAPDPRRLSPARTAHPRPGPGRRFGRAARVGSGGTRRPGRRGRRGPRRRLARCPALGAPGRRQPRFVLALPAPAAGL